jgi:hypothetical protein
MAREVRGEAKLKRQAIDNLDLARRIRAAGRPIYIPEDDGERPCIPSDGLRVRQWAGVTESRAIACGGTAFIIYLTITSNLPQFAISDFGLRLPWKQSSFFWLEDPDEIDGPSRLYHFAFKNSPEFERSRVLNHCADVRRTYSSGHSLKGCLLGFGFDSIPEDYGHGMMIPAFVVVYDQFGRQYQCPVELRTDRMSRPPRQVSRTRNMLAHPDPIRK